MMAGTGGDATVNQCFQKPALYRDTAPTTARSKATYRRLASLLAAFKICTQPERRRNAGMRMMLHIPCATSAGEFQSPPLESSKKGFETFRPKGNGFPSLFVVFF